MRHELADREGDVVQASKPRDMPRADDRRVNVEYTTTRSLVRLATSVGVPVDRLMTPRNSTRVVRMQHRLEQFFLIVSEFRRTRSAAMLEGLRNLRKLKI